MTTALFLLLVISGFAALVHLARHDRFAPGPCTATLFGIRGRSAHSSRIVLR